MAKLVFNYGGYCWVPDEEYMYLPGKVVEPFESGSPGKVEIDGVPTHLTAAQTKETLRMDEQSLELIENMVQLKELNEASILHNLRIRFNEDEVYTSVGTILVSVNPFKLLNIYTTETLLQYQDKGHRNLPPHVYGIADAAYSELTTYGKSQACIVSGESGAGKTEATKIFLQYIAEISTQASNASKTEKNIDIKTGNEKVSLQEQILKANPLMEAFGNAKTLRNNNSSRFGKWIEIKFNTRMGTVIGGSIIQYLLEKSRIITQAEGERNYHIFYNFCAGALLDSAVRDKFRIGDVEDYHYLNQSGCIYADGINDERDWEDILASMEVMGMDLNEIDDVLRTVAGVMHLGNIVFEKGASDYQENSKVTNTDMLELAASQLGTTGEKLERALTSKDISTNKDKMCKTNNIDQAIDARDALAKGTYSFLFEWLIQRINLSLAKNHGSKEKVLEKHTSIIGVLDIFGFEIFDWNSFEQLCINYCNEKLQNHFNNHIFQLEQKEYKSEGVDVSQITFVDNQPTLDLFEKKGNGIFVTLEEERQVPKGSDEGFLKKITRKQDGHPNFKKPGVKTNYERASFTVVHYAGEVMYNVTGFLEKNSDALTNDLDSIMKASTIPFVSELFKKYGKNENNTGTRYQQKSIGSKFKEQLSRLMKTLYSTEPHFIRCIKPNNEKEGGVFNEELVLAQLRYAGLLEVCRIRRFGYPVRKDFKDFMFRYGVLSETPQESTVKLCKYLSSKGLMPEGKYQIGKSKVFIRNEPYNNLESEREKAVKVQAILLQRMGRGFISRVEYRNYKILLANLTVAMKKREIKTLQQALIDSGDLPHQGVHMHQVIDAKVLLERLEEEARVTNLLEEAIKTREMNQLTSVAEAAAHMNFDSPVVKKAKKLIETIKLERKTINELKAAMNARDLALISTALKTASKLGLGNRKEAQQAEVLRAKLEEADRIIRQIEKAIQSKNINELRETLNAATEAGFEENEAYKSGKITMNEWLAAEDEAKQAEVRAEQEKKEAEHKQKIEAIQTEIMQALKEEDMDKVSDLKTKAIDAGMNEKTLKSIFATADQMESNKESIAALEAAMKTMETMAQSKNGITEAEVGSFSKAVNGARNNGLSDKVPIMADAMNMLSRMKKQLDAQKKLKAALASQEFNQLRDAIQAADDVSMETELVFQARDMIKDKDKDRQISVRMQQSEEEIDADEFERRRNQNVLMAKNERFHWTKYYKIRSNGDYSKGIFFNKSRAIDTKLCYQKSVIPKSILNLKTKELNKSALAINKSLLGYCGEQPMQFPATLAQDILIKGLESADLVDEIFIQLCKHLTENSKPESVGRTWQLMCMAVGTFPPSGDFEHYLLNFLIDHITVPGLVGNYARYSLRRLEGILIRGASGFVPTIDEILAYKERPPVLSSIELVDGTHLTEDLPIPPDLNVMKVLEICIHFLSLNDDRKDTFGIFVQDDEDTSDYSSALPQSSYSAMHLQDDADASGLPPLPMLDGPQPPPRTPRPLRSKDYIGDVVVQMSRQKRKSTFVFKRKLFLPGSDEKSADPCFSRLMYLQAADDIISGKVAVPDENDMVLLSAIAIAADDTEDSFPNTEQELLDADLTEYIPLSWRSKKTDANWARAVLAQRGKVIKKPQGQLEAQYVSMVSKYPLWGLHFFYVRKDVEGSDMICGVSHKGLHFFSLQHKQLQLYKYSELERWGGSSHRFWVLVNDKSKKKKVRVTLFTSQARDMSNLIVDYAKIMQTQ